MAKVLVVGGAGYVGSATAAYLIDRGHEVWIYDDLSTGYRELILGMGFTEARAGDREALTALLRTHRFDCVMHFAAKSLVGESMVQPELYFENNVEQTRELVDVLIAEKIPAFVFSSTCAIFGDPGERDIDESLPPKPINPYGETKLAVEKHLVTMARTRGLRSVSLRYFNAAGAEPELRVGELHCPETHLIPNVFRAAQEGREVQIFGGDYSTLDGTCVRDYVHVTDLAQAHEAAMLRLLARPADGQGSFEAFNLGSEQGFSVHEIVVKAGRLLGREIPSRILPRRAGDPPRLVAQSKLARQELGFKVAPDSLDRILSSALEWEKRSRVLRKAIFLDRDGTLNVDPGYLSRPEQLALLPGVGPALKSLKEAGYLLVVVSNQSGVGRGLISKDVVPRINGRMQELLAPFGVSIDHVELCYHRPEEDCECRKPKAKLLMDSALKLRIDLSSSYMIGDKVTDLGAGRAAHCRGNILVRTGEGSRSEAQLRPGDADYVARDLAEAAGRILRR